MKSYKPIDTQKLLVKISWSHTQKVLFWGVSKMAFTIHTVYIQVLWDTQSLEQSGSRDLLVTYEVHHTSNF